MKVYEARGYQYKQTPSIVLKGKWLSELGFNIGE
ncbi:MAG: type I toxin-antitoxin system SymE family toxin, partial [Coprococcus comes]|nr:type I toxin-antitoxin system SymE family toxin [Coprococcus comes]